MDRFATFNCGGAEIRPDLVWREAIAERLTKSWTSSAERFAIRSKYIYAAFACETLNKLKLRGMYRKWKKKIA